MKVCFFSNTNKYGLSGASLSLLNIIEELTKRGYEIILISNNEDLNKLCPPEVKIINSTIQTMRTPIKTSKAKKIIKYIYKSLYNQIIFVRLLMELKSIDFDLIHINVIESSIPAKIALKLKKPYIWHIRQFVEEDFNLVLLNEKHIYDLMKKANLLIGISKSIKLKFEKKLNKEVYLLYNGVPLETYLLPDKEILNNKQLNILVSGRIHRNKGQMDVLMAVEKLIREDFDVNLYIVGSKNDKEYVNKIFSFIQMNGIEDFIIVKDHVDDLSSLRKKCDIGITSSKKEAFGRVTIENMLSGLLTIGTDSGGTPEIIQNEKTGYLYEPGNIEELYFILKESIINIEKSKTIANSGRKYAKEKFSIENVVSSLEEEYQKLR